MDRITRESIKQIQEWNQEHTYRDDSLFTNKLVNAGLTSVQIAVVLLAIDSTCPHCWDSDKGCQCWNDE